jgi:serine-type D-Ala-D-Ala carboxypeptidase
MKLLVLEKKLQDQIALNINDVTPGLVLRAYQGGRKVLDIVVGQTWPYYDLSSLTKIIFTAQILMQDFEKNRWDFETKVSHFLPWFPHKEMKMTQLLTHSSGLPWWRPFYKQVSVSEHKLETLKELLISTELENQGKSVYSDLGFLTLIFILQEIHQKSLHDIWLATKSDFYEGTTLDFNYLNQELARKELYAPTEECSWRKKLIQGVVHDENTYALDGVSTHAGLFGSIDDLGTFLIALRSQVLGIGKSPVKMKTAKKFIARALPEGTGDWAMGFMLPTPGSASCGSHFDLSSYGHTGFTGTSLWYDPKQDLAIAILSNRVLYGRENTAFKNLRPQIHNWVVEGLRKAAY